MGEAPKIAVGDVLDGKYEITNILGSGAMGVVYEAMHTRLKRKVALKTLRAEYANNARLMDRFEREARASSAIGHPNIVQIFDAGGENAAVPYLAMERLQGENLGDLLREVKHLQTARAVDICCQLLEGLAAAHGVGILHRDIKPDNIFITKDQDGNELVKILDFGISKILDLSDSEHGAQQGGNITQAGVVVGTPNYMSPEQVCASPDIDLRADLWSVVCVLYKCLTGRTPFKGQSRQQLMAATLQGEFVPLQIRCPDAPLALTAIIRRGLMVDIKDRYQSARALLDALKQVRISKDADTIRVPDGAGGDLGHTVGEDISDTLEDSPNPSSVSAPATVSAVDATMLAAFGNLADRFVEQDAGLASPAPAALPAEKQPAAKSIKDRGLPSANPFAPPGSEEEVSLDLDIAPSAGPRPRSREAPIKKGKRASKNEKPASKPAAARAKSRRATVTRAEPSRMGPVLLKVAVFVVILGLGGGVYKYATEGYVFSPNVPRAASLSLKVAPEGAQIFLDEVREFDSELSLTTNDQHTLRIAAKNRMEMMATIEPEPGASYTVAVSLSHPMFKLNAQFVAAPKEVTGEVPSASIIDAARKKLHAFGTCGLRLFDAISEIPSDTSRLGALWVLDRGLTDECGSTLDLTVDMKPHRPAVDDATRSLRMSISTYNKSVAAFQLSTGASRAILKDRERDLKAALRGLKATSQDFKKAMNQEQSRWIALEVLRVDALVGDALHSQVRNLAFSADSWMRGTLSGADTSGARSRMIDYYTFLTTAQESRREEFDARGVTGYLHALQPLMASGKDEHTVALHNYAVDVFNKIRLPLHVEVERGEL